MRLVDKSQTAVGVAFPRIGRVKEHTAPRQNSIGFSQQRSDPTHVEVLAAWPVDASETFSDEVAYRLFPMTVVGCVDGILRRIDGNLNTSTNGLVCLVVSIKREDINTVAEGEDQRGLRTVDSETGCQLGRAWSRESCATIQRSADNRKDCPYGHIGIDV